MSPRIPSRVRAVGSKLKHRLRKDAGASQPVADESLLRSHHQLVHFRERLRAMGLLDLFDPQAEDWAPFLRFAPPGHFYSPIPLLSEVEAQAGAVQAAAARTAGIDLRSAEQLELFRTLAGIARDWPFPVDAAEGFRYFTGPGNFAFGPGDGMILYAMLRHLRPKRLVEVGSGFSSALTLDTNDRYLDGSMSVTFIEPYPELLQSLVGDSPNAEILAVPVQEVGDEVFGRLEAGDVLFLDTTHVSRFGSDVNDLFTRVIPSVAPGVVIHIHDVFWPFEYPMEWLREGRAWNEQYVLRSFLQFNDEFEILLFSGWLSHHHLDVIEAELPGMLENLGGSFWFRRRP